MTTQMLKTSAATTTDRRLISAEELSTASITLSEEELEDVTGGFVPAAMAAPGFLIGKIIKAISG